MPPVQLYETAPVPFNVTGVAAQTVTEGEAVKLTVGKAFTVSVATPDVATGLHDPLAMQRKLYPVMLANTGFTVRELVVAPE